MALEATAHARGRNNFWLKSLRCLNYIREAERAEGNAASTREDSEQISAALDAIARDFFAHALQSKSRSQ
jgi:hypothetical protein